MYKNILVAVDESNTSALALKEAIRLHLLFPNSALKIIHIVDEYVTNYDTVYFTPADLQKAIKNAGILLLKDIEIKLQAEHVPNFETKLIEISSITKKPYQTITEEAKAWPADLIIMGTHGRRGFSHLFLGSVAEGVVRTATVPLLLIRGN